MDVTCVDALAPLNIPVTTMKDGNTAALAEAFKLFEYSNLNNMYTFDPVGVKILGQLGPNAHDLYKIIGQSLFEIILLTCTLLMERQNVEYLDFFFLSFQTIKLSIFTCKLLLNPQL